MTLTLSGTVTHHHDSVQKAPKLTGANQEHVTRPTLVLFGGSWLWRSIPWALSLNITHTDTDNNTGS